MATAIWKENSCCSQNKPKREQETFLFSRMQGKQMTSKQNRGTQSDFVKDLIKRSSDGSKHLLTGTSVQQKQQKPEMVNVSLWSEKETETKTVRRPKDTDHSSINRNNVQYVHKQKEKAMVVVLVGASGEGNAEFQFMNEFTGLLLRRYARACQNLFVCDIFI